MSTFSSIEKALPSFILRNRASHIWRHFFSLRLLKCGRWESDEEYIKRDSRVRGLISGWVKTLKRLWSEWWLDWSLQDSHRLKQKNRKHVRVQWLAWTKERKNTLHRRVRLVSSGYWTQTPSFLITLTLRKTPDLFFFQPERKNILGLKLWFESQVIQINKL